MRRLLLSSLLIGLAALGTPSHLAAQVFQVIAGRSTLFNATGGSVQFKTSSSDGQIGIGFVDGRFRSGVTFHTRLKGTVLSVGDDAIRFILPTDVFDNSHYFLARGVGVLHASDSGRVYGFVGAVTQGYVTPFFPAAHRDRALAAVFVDRRLSRRMRLVSRNLFSGQLTSIHSLEWTPRRSIKAAVSAGVGSNEGYGAVGADFDRENLRLKMSYIVEGDRFQRVRTPALLISELEKENVAVVYRPFRALSLGGVHQHISQPPLDGQAPVRAAVDEFNSSVNVLKFGVGGGLYQSRIQGRSALGANLFVRRDLMRRLSVAGNLFQTRPDLGPASMTYTVTTRFVVNQKLAATQLLIRSNGQTTFGFGGEFTSNRISLNVNTQTVFVPLRLDKPFQQALGVNASLYLPGSLHLTVGSFVAPDGRVRYTCGLSRFLYRRMAAAAWSDGASFRFPKFVVKGIVVDERGRPIEGAAIDINGDAAYSDSAGQFMMRLKQHGPFPVRVALDEFVAPGLYEIVAAPASTIALEEDRIVPLKIVLRRVRSKDGPE